MFKHVLEVGIRCACLKLLVLVDAAVKLDGEDQEHGEDEDLSGAELHFLESVNFPLSQLCATLSAVSREVQKWSALPRRFLVFLPQDIGHLIIGAIFLPLSLPRLRRLIAVIAGNWAMMSHIIS